MLVGGTCGLGYGNVIDEAPFGWDAKESDFRYPKCQLHPASDTRTSGQVKFHS